MQINLHKLAATTPKTRRGIQTSNLPAKELAKKLGISMDTVYRWKKRKDVHDRSHARHNLLSSLNQEEEEIVKELRIRLQLSLDDITEVINRCVNKDLSRDAIYRCIKRHGISKRISDSTKNTYVNFEEVKEPGFIHMDLKFLTNLDGKRSYVYVAIDRYSRYVYTEILYDRAPKTAAAFIKRFMKHFPYPVKTILTDNGFEWTDRCAGFVKSQGTGNHPVDIVCKQAGVKHKLTRIRRPQTNGMVERFNRRITEAIAAKQKVHTNGGRNTFLSHKDRNEYISNFVTCYNRTRLLCLKYRTPMERLKSFRNHTQHNMKTEI